MEYRTLENIDSICIYEAFTQAFSDYQVSVDMSFKSFETMLKRNGFMPAVSVGAFVDKTLVAFILNGVREWDNEKTVYDLGTGVIPDFRRTGIMGELLNLVSAICIKNKIRVYQLEVIQEVQMTVPVEVQKSQIAILVEVLIQEVQAQIHLITEEVAIHQIQVTVHQAMALIHRQLMENNILQK